MISYYRGRWPDPEVPENEPLWFHFEVEVEADAVLRTAHLFADGHVERNSVALEEQNGDSCPSLVDGPFMQTAKDVPPEGMMPDEFEALWEQGTDKPFWFVS